MSGPRRLAAVPSRREQQVLDWLGENQSAPARDVLERAFAELPRIRQRRRWPWTRLEERLRPEPFGSHQARLLALAVAAMLLLALLGGTLLTVGQRNLGLRALDPPAGPLLSPEPSLSAVFPLRDPLLDFVVGADSRHLFTIRSDGSNRVAVR